jgi:hypothetical protein
VSGLQNEFYLTDEQGLEIMNVIELYPTASEYWITGHDTFGALSFGDLKSFALNTFTSVTSKLYSPFDVTYEFKHPNILRISPVPTLGTTYVYSYERIHNPDLSGIPNEMQMYFMKFALSDIMINIGRIRKKYGGGNLTTPFGDIPLETDIYDEGKDTKREIIEKLEMGPLMNITFDVG